MLKLLAKRILRPTYRYGMPFIASRNELPFILVRRDLVGEGAEIGVYRGEFSAHLLRHWPGTLYSIDPWMFFPREEYPDVLNVSQQGHDEAYASATEALSSYGERSRILRLTSAAAAPRFDDGQLDFAYIDAQHHFEAVREDLEHWYPKVKPGGILAGHDYFDGVRDTREYAVKSAVDGFARSNGLDVLSSRETDWPSWLIPKPVRL